MAKPLKTTGLAELAAFKRRVSRQWAMRQIAKPDHDYIIARLDEIEARITSMQEEGEEELL